MELRRENICKNTRIDESNSNQRKREFNFFKNTIDSLKKTAKLVGFAVGAAVIVASCGGPKKTSTDSGAEIADIVEDIPEEADVPNTEYDVIEEDVIEDDVIEGDTESEDIIEEDESEIACIEGGAISGTVPPIISNTSTESLGFNGPADEMVYGDAEITIGADVSTTGLLMLDECPYEDAVAAFGVHGTSVLVAPSWRIDITNANAELSYVDAEVCLPPDEPFPISMFEDSTNISVIPALLGSVDRSAVVGFADILAVGLFDDTGEVASPVLLDSADYEVKSIAVISTSSSLSLNSTVYSNTGAELSSNVLEAPLDAKSSKTLKISQLDSDDSMLPNIGRWRAEGLGGPDSSVYICLRPCLPDPASTPIEKTVEITGLDITGVIDDACGKLFASFDIVSVDAVFDPTRSPPYGISPPHLAGDYSILTGMHYGDGLDAMSSLSPKVYLFMRRESTTILDSGELIVMDITLTIQLETRNANPATGTADTAELSFNVRLSVPTSGDYLSICGCDASLP